MARVTTQTSTRTAPRWTGDFLPPERILPGGAKLDPAQFFAEDSVVVNVGAAGAAIDAVSVPVDALSGPIPSGTTIHFSGKKYLTTTAAAVAGATALAVQALATALVDADVATYPGIKEVSVQSGTLLGRTYTERDALTPFGPAADADDEFYLLLFDVKDANINNDADLYRHGGMVFENYLPVFSSLSVALKAKIRLLYECSIGVN